MGYDGNEEVHFNQKQLLLTFVSGWAKGTIPASHITQAKRASTVMSSILQEEEQWSENMKSDSYSLFRVL